MAKTEGEHRCMNDGYPAPACLLWSGRTYGGPGWHRSFAQRHTVRNVLCWRLSAPAVATSQRQHTVSEARRQAKLTWLPILVGEHVCVCGGGTEKTLLQIMLPGYATLPAIPGNQPVQNLQIARISRDRRLAAHRRDTPHSHPTCMIWCPCPVRQLQVRPHKQYLHRQGRNDSLPYPHGRIHSCRQRA